MRNSTDSNLKRRNLTFPDNFVEDMAALRKKTGAQSDAELLRKAFRLYEHIVKHHDGMCYVRDEKGAEQKLVAI